MNNRILGILAVIGVAGGSMGCGGSDTSGGVGGSGGVAGASHASAGNGGSFSLPNQGGVTLSVRLPASPANGSTCPDSGTTYPAGDPAPSNTNPGTSLVDGEGGARVSCAVEGTGPFTFSGSLAATTSAGESFPIQVVFSEGQVGTDFNGTAKVAVYTPKLSATYTSELCTVKIISGQIKGGAIWASFTCPSLMQPPAGLCEASGVFVFENCAGS